jgi:hypothetical protein
MPKILLLFLSCWTVCASAQSDSLSKLLQGRTGCGIVNKKHKTQVTSAQTGPLAGQCLYVVDGIPRELQEIAKLDPHEIESITFLKESNTKAIFSCRLSKGVVLITMKRAGNVRLKIVDENDSSIIEKATVRVVSNAKAGIFLSDENGELVLPTLLKGQSHEVEISSIGYRSDRRKISFDSNQQVIVRLKREVQQLDAVVISSHIGWRRFRCGACVKIRKCYEHTTQSQKADLLSDFVIYPNPVSRGVSLTMLPKQDMKGSYQILTVSGQILRSGTLHQSAKQPLLISTLGLKAGPYFIRLYDNLSNKFVTEKFIIQ